MPVRHNKAFWSDLCDDIMEVVEKGFAEVFFLPQSYTRAVLTFLPKKGDLHYIKDWWPVSLLCTDYNVHCQKCWQTDQRR